MICSKEIKFELNLPDALPIIVIAVRVKTSLSDWLHWRVVEASTGQPVSSYLLSSEQKELIDNEVWKRLEDWKGAQ